MPLKTRSNFLLTIFFLFTGYLIIGCASMQRPQGGPRDRTPPKLLKATPVNMTRNFAAKQIILDFDEYVKLNNQYQEISISPAVEKPLEYKLKQRSLVIDLSDTLLKNTTYVINFGKAISDNTEGNLLKNFTYVFSTGNQIDSLSISGNVSNTLTAGREKDATVMIFPAKQDSLLFGKKKPSYFTTTDSTGNFSLNNLHEGEYTIYALKEASPDKIYNNDNELIAFRKKHIILKNDVSDVQLNLFKQTPDKFRIVSKNFDADGKISLLFNKPLTSPSIKINYPAGFDDKKIVDISKTKDTALVYMRDMNFDSLSVVINDLNKPIDTIFVRKGLKEEFKRTIGIGYNINNDAKLRPNTDLEMVANVPIERFDMGKIRLLEDSVPISGLNLIKDTSNPRRFVLKNKWRQKARYELIFGEGSITDIYGGQNRELTKRFTIDRPENYGTLTIKYTLADTAVNKSYIIEIVNQNKNILRTDIITKSTSIVYKNFITGKYRIKVTYDANKNGKMDSGNVRLKAYPENTWYYEKEITLRPNWESEEAITIPKEVITP
jgi:hypothetical protein